MKKAAVVGTAAVVFLLGGAAARTVAHEANASASVESQAVVLIDQGVAHLKKTTISYPQWVQRKYAPGVRETTEWAKAFSAFAAARQLLVTSTPTTTSAPPTTTTVAPPPTTTASPPTTTAPPTTTSKRANVWVRRP